MLSFVGNKNEKFNKYDVKKIKMMCNEMKYDKVTRYWAESIGLKEEWELVYIIGVGRVKVVCVC